MGKQRVEGDPELDFRRERVKAETRRWRSEREERKKNEFSKGSYGRENNSKGNPNLCDAIKTRLRYVR